jgi:hypothetical protein
VLSPGRISQNGRILAGCSEVRPLPALSGEGALATRELVKRPAPIVRALLGTNVRRQPLLASWLVLLVASEPDSPETASKTRRFRRSELFLGTATSLLVNTS